MSTKPRIVAPGVIYQVSSKGVQNLQMFKSDLIKSFFLEQLAKTLKKYSFTCHAFSITTNQYHLILQADQQSISDTMQQFNSIIAKKVNKVLNRDGTVFATRFKSVIVEEDKLKELIATVHLQPVNQGECSLDNIDNYQWCSHSVLLSNNNSDIITKDRILKLLKISSEKEYWDYIRNIHDNDNLSSIIKDINCAKQSFSKPELWIIGKPEFVKQVIKLDQCRRLRIARHISENITIEKVHDKVVKLLTLHGDDLFRAGRFNVKSTARELFAVLCKQRYDFSGVETAQYLKVTDSAVSKMVSRFSKVINGCSLKELIIAEIS